MSFLENSKLVEDIVNNTPDKKPREFKIYNIFAVIAVVAAVAYIYSLFFGTTSLPTLFEIESKKEQLDSEYQKLQNQNQKLQKKYFELIQLTPDDDLF